MLLFLFVEGEEVEEKALKNGGDGARVRVESAQNTLAAFLIMIIAKKRELGV